MFVLTRQHRVTDRVWEPDWSLLLNPRTKPESVVESMSKVFVSTGCVIAIADRVKIKQFPLDFMVESGRAVFRLLELILRQRQRAEAVYWE